MNLYLHPRWSGKTSAILDYERQYILELLFLEDLPSQQRMKLRRTLNKLNKEVKERRKHEITLNNNSLSFDYLMHNQQNLIPEL